MKQILILFAILICGISNGQVPDTNTYVFCDIMALSRVVSDVDNGQNVNLFYDFGDGNVYSPTNPFKDEVTHIPIILNSIATCLNYFSEKKWVFVGVSSMTVSGGISQRWATHYLLKKRKFN